MQSFSFWLLFWIPVFLIGLKVLFIFCVCKTFTFCVLPWWMMIRFSARAVDALAMPYVVSD